MFRSRKIFFSFFLMISVCWGALPRAAGAMDSRYLSVFNSDTGVRLYQKGDVETAVQKFIRALLIDPANPVAQKYLSDIGKNNQTFSLQRRQELLRIVELLDYGNFLHSRIERFQYDNAQIIRFVARHDDTGQVLAKLSGSIQATMKELPDTNLMPSEDETAKLLSPEVNFSSIINIFVQRKDRLLRELDSIEKVNQDLRQEKDKMISAMKIDQQEQLKKLIDQQIRQMRAAGVVAVKGAGPVSENPEIPKLRQELRGMRSQLSGLQQKFRDTDQKVVAMTKEVAGMSLELYEKNQTIAAKDHQIEQLNSSLTDAQQRLTLVQKLMQEKNQQLDRLSQAGSAETPAAAGAQSAPNVPADMMAQLRAGQAQILGLQKKFAQLGQQYQALQKKLKEKDGAITQLKQTVNLKNDRILQYKNAAATTEADLKQTGGILQIYKGRLAKTHAELEKKNAMLQYLEDRLNRLSSLQGPAPALPDHHATMGAADSAPVDAGEMKLWPPQNILRKTLVDVKNLPSSNL